ncbi:MAG: glycosyltransferase, partial [Muribaculaceae bacterium]|nr:glycosyltransferase [Muribaculaceae bacterium]
MNTSDKTTPYFSIIVPVYNRIDEVDALLSSLCQQSIHNFEVIIVEDGSSEPCRDVCQKYADMGLNVKYYFKENEGRSIARNYGMERATGSYLIFFDSDCVIPPTYFETVTKALAENPLDCFGGPDAAHDSFSNLQKAINFAMTSFLTTGGIRGGKHSLEKFTPRTFNMGFSSDVYRHVGGFREMFSEDIDMSTRIKNVGYTIGLLADSPVWHKRRLDLKKFFRQVHIFGMSRITLHYLYPGSLKLVHALPALAVILALVFIILGLTVSPWWFAPFGVYALALFASALLKTRSFKVALLSLHASLVKIVG